MLLLESTLKYVRFMNDCNVKNMSFYNFLKKRLLQKNNLRSHVTKKFDRVYVRFLICQLYRFKE